MPETAEVFLQPWDPPGDYSEIICGTRKLPLLVDRDQRALTKGLFLLLLFMDALHGRRQHL